MCRGETFTLLTVGDDAIASVFPGWSTYRLAIGAPIENARQTIPVIISVCDNCGYMLSFLRTVVEAWVEGERAKKGASS
jgi:hypothetical protein